MLMIIDIRISTTPIAIATPRTTLTFSIASNGFSSKPSTLYIGSRTCSNPNTDPKINPKNALDSPIRDITAHSLFPVFL